MAKKKTKKLQIFFRNQIGVLIFAFKRVKLCFELVKKDLDQVSKLTNCKILI
jgi:hypothetical protein